jgi:hypothetical protein
MKNAAGDTRRMTINKGPARIRVYAYNPTGQVDYS